MSSRVLLAVGLLIGLAGWLFFSFVDFAPPETSGGSAPAAKVESEEAGRGADVVDAAASVQPEREVARAAPSVDEEPGEPAAVAVPGEAVGAEESAEDAPYRLRVRVADDLGRPLTELALRARMMFEQPGGDLTWNADLEATSDAQGEALFAIDERAAEEQPMGVRIGSASDDRYGYVAPCPAMVDGELDVGLVQLMEARERYPVALVEGTVLDSAGRPVPGAYGYVSNSFMASLDDAAADPSADEWGPFDEGQIVISGDGRFTAYGPAGPRTVQLDFMAPRHESYFDWEVDAPMVGYRAVLEPSLQFTGRLLVPEPGPGPDQYAVWISREGMGTGINAAPDGSFSVAGGSSSLRIEVRYPSLGWRLYNHEFHLEPNSDGDLGLLDLRATARVIELQVLDAAGQPRAEQSLSARAEGEGAETTAIGSSVELTTDGSGRLQVVLPVEAEVLELWRQEQNPIPQPAPRVRIDTLAPPPTVIIE